MRRWIIRILLGSIITFICFAATLGLFIPLIKGWSLRHTLLAAVEDATVIRAIEHSDRFDRPSDLTAPYKERVLSSVTLSESQVPKLREAFTWSLDYSFAIKKACIFSSHHRVEIVGKTGKITVLEICFHCGELVLDGEEQRIFPIGWDGTFRNFVGSLGMSPIPKESNPSP